VNTGGLTGANDGAIMYSSAAGTVSSTTSGGSCGGVGGLVGINAATTDAEIQSSFSTAAVSGSAMCFVGGLVGINGNYGYGYVTRSDATGTVSLTNSSNSCFSGPAIGGLVGLNLTGDIDSSYATGATSGQDYSDSVGGLVGYNNTIGIVGFGTAKGAVSDSQVCLCGGAIGSNYNQVSDTVSYGTVTGASGSDVGGFVGDDETYGGGNSDDSWDMTTSGINNPSQGAGNTPNDPGITGFD
jgi:hypothetical protein